MSHFIEPSVFVFRETTGNPDKPIPKLGISQKKFSMKIRHSQTVLMGLVLFWTQLLSSCGFAKWTTFHEGTYNGMPYALQSREEKGFSTNHIDWRVKLGQLPAAEITPATTDWGPPYSNDIFGTAPYCYTAQNIPAYQPEEDTSFQAGEHEYTMLYLSPKTFSKADYEQYCAFMKSEWPRIDSQYAGEKYSRFPHIIGLVYARQDDITKIYKGSYNPYPGIQPAKLKKVFIRIQNDGRVQLVDDDQWRNMSYSGLSTRVQMPGKRLYLDTNPTNGGLGSIAVIHTFKDGQGRSPDMDFQIIQK